VTVAIIDTGVDVGHPDLDRHTISQRNFVNTDSREFKLDRHGTEVAGVIGAVADNGVGIVGIAPDARLLALKACWQPSAGASRAVCNSFTLAQALEATIVAHADIVNLSLAGPPDPLLARLATTH
jgi:subtilisin family serine protease